MKVIISASAKRDLNLLFVYIKDDIHNEIAARNTVSKILLRIKMLESFPETGPTFDGISESLRSYRYLVADNYLIIYKIVSSEIRIVHIPYARSNYAQLLQG